MPIGGYFTKAGSASLDLVKSILREHAEKNFVQRILSPEDYPKVANADGSYSTHRMAWAPADNGGYVYPTVVQGSDGRLIEMNDDQAWEHAVRTGEIIGFENPSMADWFSRYYKLYWGSKK